MDSAACLAIPTFLFDHIKSGEPCTLSDRFISELQVEFDSQVHITQDTISPLLVQILDECHGTEEIVNNRRKVKILGDYLQNASDGLENIISGGSVGDGFLRYTSDIDLMKVLKTVVVTYPDQIHLIPRHSLHKTILLMRETGSRPGYVTLELSQIANGEGRNAIFQNALVPLRDSRFVSSDIYRQGNVDTANVMGDAESVSNGPCTTAITERRSSVDIAYAFPCVCWPSEANEWIHRTRLHGWPAQTMIDRIVQDGCHLVPVGDKCSTDTLLQWRISFACAEQILVHSLTHPQFRVYGLLKYFLTQIKHLLDHIIGDSDIICSYFLKTIIFYAVENSPSLFWNEQNTFICFRFCLSMLIAWVKSGYCPNYFIGNNNMFVRKVHGESRQKLLHFLRDIYALKWMCLSVEPVNTLSIGLMMQQPQRMNCRLTPECLRDLNLFGECLILHAPPTRSVYASVKCLHAAHTDVDEFIAYYALVSTLYNIAGELFNEYNTAISNKQKYATLKKCRTLLKPQTSGWLLLAAFHYLTGDYSKTLQVCADMRSTFRVFVGGHFQFSEREYESYQRQYCGKGYTYCHKLKEGIYSCIVVWKDNIMLFPPHLHLEITKHQIGIFIPPLPYAIFLSFLCYQEFGDLRRRDTELINLRAANYDPKQGGHKYWIVHTLLGICYQTVGDNRRAIRSFTDSLRVMPEHNPAIERIEALTGSQ